MKARHILFEGEADVMDVFRKELKRVEDSLSKVEEIYKKDMRWIDRLSDRIAEKAGSWGFIILFSLFIIVWLILNTFILITDPVDPFPYILLNLFLSMVAALQAPFILMSQNRAAKRDQIRAELDLEKDIRDLQIDQHSHRLLLELKQEVRKIRKKWE